MSLKKIKPILVAAAAIIGLTHFIPSAHSSTPKDDSNIEQRIADIRDRFSTLQQMDNELAKKIREKSRLSQWFNFPNWPNWGDWRNWNNQRWLNW